MRRSLGYHPQCYATDGMWMDSQSQQPSYAVHEEAWTSENDYHKQFSGMYIKPGANYVDFSKQHGIGNPGMLQESWHHGGLDSFEHGLNGSNAHLYHQPGYVHGGKKLPFYSATAASHQFSNNSAKFNSYYGRQDGAYNYSEDSEFEIYSEEHHGPATVKVDEMRYDRHYGGGDVRYANPYGGGRKMMNPPGRGVYWAVKGV